MSDRPMRLKYLTKMKIILCIFLLCITAVSVFGQSVELNGIVGESVKFPAAVKTSGTLMYWGVTIGDVNSGRFTRARNEKYSRRLQWDSSTGLFSLSELKEEDSGVYTVQNTHQNITTVFQLNVYIPVSKPHVSITHNEYPCTVECTAERGTGVTLSWYREGEKEPYVSSRVARAPHLPQTVERSGTYTCEAKNSVSNEKASITVGAHCTAGLSTGTIVAIIFAVVASIIAVAVLIAVFFAVLYRRNRSKRKHPTKDDEQAVLQDGNRSKRKHPTKDDEQAVLQDGTKTERRDEQAVLQDDEQAVLQDDTGSKSKGTKTERRDEQAVLQDGTKTERRDEQAVLQDAFRRIILDKEAVLQADEQILFQDVRDFIYRWIALKMMTPSLLTGVPLNQATPEVGTA